MLEVHAGKRHDDEHEQGRDVVSSARASGSAVQPSAEVATAEAPGSSVRAVTRALDVLLAFEPYDKELTATQLLERLSLSRPTLYRLLHTLEQRGFVISEGNPQTFRLGPAIARLSYVWRSGLDIAGMAQPMLQRLWQQTNETIALYLLEGASRVCVAEIPSRQPLSFKRGVGHSDAVVRGASGKVILAFMPDPTGYFRHLDAADRKRLQDELRGIRKAGYAVSLQELIQGATAIAAPVFAAHGEVIGSLAVFGPTVRNDKKQVARFAALLREEARLLSKNLGADNVND